MANAATSLPWEFLAVEQGLKGGGQPHSHVKHLLSASGSIPFKVWRLSKPLQVFAVLLGLAVLRLGGWLVWRAVSTGWRPVLSVSALLWVLAPLLLLAVSSRHCERLVESVFVTSRHVTSRHVTSCHVTSRAQGRCQRCTGGP